MNKPRVIGTAFIAAAALMILSVANASATLWLLGGRSITSVLKVATHGITILHHTGGTVGSEFLECSLLWDGTVGPSGTGLIEKILNLTGTEEGLIRCTSTASLCKEPLVHFENLPWKTELLLIGGLTWDDFMQGPGVTHEPAIDVLCSGTLVLVCEGLFRIHFVENLTDGALLSWSGVSLKSCSDGGELILEQPVGKSTELLGFTVS